MSTPKKYENVVLNITIEDPTNGRIQNYLVKGVIYSEPAQDMILLQGEASEKYKVSVTFNKQQQ